MSLGAGLAEVCAETSVAEGDPMAQVAETPCSADGRTNRVRVAARRKLNSAEGAVHRAVLSVRRPFLVTLIAGLLVAAIAACSSPATVPNASGGPTQGSGGPRSGAIAILANGNMAYTCAILVDGAVKCWGDNDMGQLGDGTATSSSTAVAVSGLTGATALFEASDDQETCALVAGGAVMCWGDAQGLGEGTTPLPIPGLSGVTAISTLKVTCALVTDGTVKCWEYTPRSSGFKVTDAGLSGATAISGNCAIVAGGAVRCWHVSPIVVVVPASGPSPTPVPSGPEVVPDLSGATAIAVEPGSFESDLCAIVESGAVKCSQWDSDRDQYSTAVAVPGLTGTTQIIATGGGGYCALLAGGTVKCWGPNNYGQLGDGTTTDSATPVAVSGLSGATGIVSGGSSTCALLAGGTAKCWGANSDGELGDGTTTDRSTPVAVSGLSGATAISVGGRHSCALLASGAVKCWGSNHNGQLGDGTNTDSLTPVMVQGL
jgi:hypothetical protein